MPDMLKNNLNFLRKEKKMSQLKFSNLLNIKRSTYANWESGHTEPPISALWHICSFLGITIDDLVSKDISEGKTIEKIPNSEKGKVSDKVSGKVSEKMDKISNRLKENVFSNPVQENYLTNSNKANNVFDLDDYSLNWLEGFIQDQDKLKDCPMIYIPGLTKGLHFRIPIYSNNMYPTISAGDNVIITYLRTPSISIDYGNVCVLLDKQGNLFCKRVSKIELLDKMNIGDSKLLENGYELEDDNYYDDENFEIKIVKSSCNLKDYKAVFRVVEVHTRDLSAVPALQRLGYYKLKNKHENG